MTVINRDAFSTLIAEDKEWLALQPQSFESMHIECILNRITQILYDDKCSCGQTRQHDNWDKCHD